jgi:hypothetical protein
VTTAPDFRAGVRLDAAGRTGPSDADKSVRPVQQGENF